MLKKPPDESRRDDGGNPVAPFHDHVPAPTKGGAGKDLRARGSQRDTERKNEKRPR